MCECVCEWSSEEEVESASEKVSDLALSSSARSFLSVLLLLMNLPGYQPAVDTHTHTHTYVHTHTVTHTHTRYISTCVVNEQLGTCVCE